jgi:hypothetical protein
MPDFVLNRNHTHRSTNGHVITFVKGQPTFVPPVCVKEVAAFGAEPTEGERPDLLDDLPPEVVPLTGAERDGAIARAFEILRGRNNRGDFTGQGRPNPRALRDLTGFEVETRERDTAWEKFQAARVANE